MIERDSLGPLVERSRGGDRAAFDRLVEVSRDRLRASVEGWTHFQSGPPLDVEEILQDTFVRAFRSLGRFEFRGEDSFLRWLCGIAKKALAQAIHDNRRAREAADPRVLAAVEASTASQGRALRRHERFERLERSVEGLSPDHRRVLMLSRIEGLTIREIAERMERTPNAVKQLLGRALRQLRERFGHTESLGLPDRELQPRER